MVGRSPGMASGQCSSASDTGTECECAIRRQHPVAKPDDPWQIDAVPVDRFRRVDAIEAAVEPGAEIDDNRFRMLGYERAHPLVEHLGA